jgi:hypothetical protein
VQKDATTAAALGVSSTPLFFLGLVKSPGVAQAIDRIEGALPFSDFEKVLNPNLKTP